MVHELLESISEFDSEDGLSYVCAKAEALVRKDESLQEGVKKLIEHQRLRNDIDRLKAAIENEDSKIIRFTKNLARLEQKLHDATIEERDEGMVDVHGQTQKQAFTAKEVLVFSERLGQLSAQGYQEVHGYQGFHKPPAPQPKDMEFSRLRHSVPELLTQEFMLTVSDEERSLDGEELGDRSDKKEKQRHSDDADADDGGDGGEDVKTSREVELPELEIAEDQAKREKASYNDFVMPFFNEGEDDDDLEDSDSAQEADLSDDLEI